MNSEFPPTGTPDFDNEASQPALGEETAGVSGRVELTDRELFLSLGSEQCPACKLYKCEGHTVCRICFYRLPQPLRNGLFEKYNKYPEAARAALAYLADNEQL
jgi:hypothetical protein